MSILEILKRAKVIYEEYTVTIPEYFGMCYAINKATPMEDSLLHSKDIYYNDEFQWIPEFNREFLGATKEGKYWWPLDDIESRLKAFDILINIYRKKEQV